MELLKPTLTILIPAIEILGILTAMHAILFIRSAQGAIAWAITLVVVPWIALPLYWVLGRNKFFGYIESLRAGNIQSHHQLDRTIKRMERYASPMDGNQIGINAGDEVYASLAGIPFTGNNTAELLINGRATFDAMFRRMDAARHYLLLEFFIVRDDEIGTRLQELLIRKSAEGVKIFFLYDEIGSRNLSDKYIERLRDAGVEIYPFFTTRGWYNRFQINFRNHRKIVVVDGQTGFVGGHNVGDEYLGRKKKYGAWRDTHVMVEGPVVLGVQLAFAADWFWAVRRKLEIAWNVHPAPAGGMNILPLATDPSQSLDTCLLMFLHAILSARDRVWIASPYFVPDNAIINALQVAALKGVDVRIILPGRPDKKILYLASFSFFPALLSVPGITVYRYSPGFMHQKVMIIDDHTAIIGSANFDNRSFYLNFEMNLVIKNREFTTRVERMLQDDIGHSRQVIYPSKKTSLLFKLMVRLSSLFSPIL
ncbi:MAG: cardiolipin synthase [Thermodesulfobacteriota bacterium]